MPRTSWKTTACALLWIGVATLQLHRPAEAAGIYWVDTRDGHCSNTGPGTAETPYCSITGAVAARAAPGATILVKPGTYREEVLLAASGTATSPLVLRAQGSGVILDGADDLGRRQLWSRYRGPVYLAASVTWTPKQVFVDGARLTASTAAPESLASGTFRWISGRGLYVHGGGENPGRRQALVGRRAYGFRATGRTHILVEGFEVTRHEEKSVYLSYGAAFCTIRDNLLTWARTNGVGLTAASDIVVERNSISDHADHGINLNQGTTRCVIRDNHSHHNARPGVRAANGLYLFGAPENRIERNRFHDNQDSGVNVQSGSDRNVFVQNLSWSNGDHGYDILYATGNRFVGDVAWGNLKDGFSFEGASTHSSLHNCAAVDNGLTAGEDDLYVEAGSEVGFVSDYNLFWNSTSQTPIRIAGHRYATAAALTLATGLESHGIVSNPRFVDPAAGDFHVLDGSPLIDSGTSSCPDCPPYDSDGNPRWDIPGVANTGTGSINYADRGAFEYFPRPATAAVGDRPLPWTVSRVFPNPSSGAIRCVIELPERTPVTAEIVDLMGRRVRCETSEPATGRWQFDWNGGARRAPGVYTLLVSAGSRRETRRFVLVH